MTLVDVATQVLENTNSVEFAEKATEVIDELVSESESSSYEMDELRSERDDALAREGKAKKDLTDLLATMQPLLKTLLNDYNKRRKERELKRQLSVNLTEAAPEISDISRYFEFNTNTDLRKETAELENVQTLRRSLLQSEVDLRNCRQYSDELEKNIEAVIRDNQRMAELCRNHVQKLRRRLHQSSMDLKGCREYSGKLEKDMEAVMQKIEEEAEERKQRAYDALSTVCIFVLGSILSYIKMTQEPGMRKVF